MNQKRIVLPQDLIPLADHICKETGVSTHSQLFVLLLKNYGERFVKAIKEA
ncbi:MULTISPECIES: hypothetical protein [Nostocaceae]|jgi:hypothetical protein|uniref:CopG-like ribbon-helix-helix domain-containing protein n=1 Tax=Nostoc paludosum FACHB-159 TaxID=2692908 RepID=A0ABR8KKN1_9NOSO|nr:MULTISPECIES: hypothetical protein [Nostocaceae]MBD2682335.1 hypothetical protein [Nostoc sp. FACHB-857]MBD2738668.1 hypothetical protein [Nostoc paludosum FACHB-159]MCC5634150.1 hypothetical protein [Nostoc sphaeroides CHAB 2801]